MKEEALNSHENRNTKRIHYKELIQNDPKRVHADYSKFVEEIEEITLIEEGLENDFNTACLYHKLQFEEGMCAFYTIAAIITSCISYEAKKTNIGHDNYQVFTLVLVPIFNILFCKIFKNFFRFFLCYKICDYV